jgi:hypothetical protein
MTALGIALIGLGACVAVLNWFTLIATLRSGRFVSAVPLIGAALLGAGLAIVPQTRSYAWTALLADYGTLVLILALPKIIHECWAVSKFNLLYFLHTNESGRHIQIKMFRRNIAIIRGDFNPPVPCDDAGSFAASFSWVAKWRLASDGFSITDYGPSRELLISRQNGHFNTRELHYPCDSKYKHDCLDGLQLHTDKKA